MTARPFLKMAGGKTQLLPELLSRVPKKFAAYHEPFLGGGAFFFALRSKYPHLPSYLSDSNQRLITTFQAVRDAVENLISLLGSMEEQHRKGKEDFYYKTRSQNPEQLGFVGMAAWMIFLNKTCFNGLYRVNRGGGFNVPYGFYENPTICDVDNLRSCSVALRDVEIECFDFLDCNAGRGDFVYFDPPYIPLSKTSSFTSYTAGKFGLEDQASLRDLALKLRKRGAHVLLSNSGTESVKDLYSQFSVEKVSARRNINSKGAGRGAISEYLIW